MILIQQASILSDYIEKQRGKGLSIGFVPTMGALHDAHLQLVNYSATVADVTVCSIFVNPTQFNDPHDFKNYPNTIDSDLRMLSNSNADVVFLPSVTSMYPSGIKSLEQYDLGYLETVLEGHYRPGHFQGVCQVMSRLLQLTDPDFLCMGQKDYQQSMVIRRLIELMRIKAALITYPTVRENDGLAMSSRNMRLDTDARKRASLLYEVLLEMKTKLAPGNLDNLKEQAVAKLENGGFKVDYVEIADADNLRPYTEWNGRASLVALVAAYLGEVRLIDNMLLNN
jgi:pantoate--beta-alanine ligase